MAKRIIIKVILPLFLLLFSNIVFANTPDQSVADRVVYFSGMFLGKPYQLEPLGEGKEGQFNQEPLVRYDRFDCETYIDTVLALSMPGNTEENILKIRYKNSIPNFYERNHFPETDWIPNNERNGFIQDITTKIAPSSAIASQTITINYRDWYKNLDEDRLKIPGLTKNQGDILLQQLRNHSCAVSSNTTTISYIKSSALSGVINNIPNGAIIMIVRPKNIPGSSMLISHMGLAIWKNHQLYLRAASSLYGQVIDLPLLSYVQNQSISGIIILKSI